MWSPLTQEVLLSKLEELFQQTQTSRMRSKVLTCRSHMNEPKQTWLCLCLITNTLMPWSHKRLVLDKKTPHLESNPKKLSISVNGGFRGKLSNLCHCNCHRENRGSSSAHLRCPQEQRWFIGCRGNRKSWREELKVYSLHGDTAPQKKQTYLSPLRYAFTFTTSN